MSPGVEKKKMFSIYDDTPEINGFSRDLLLSYLTSKEREEEDKIELSLGLSLNGRFGVDPKRKKLPRSSSIAEFLAPEAEPELSLVRTSSLPIKTGEELRKMKEIHRMKRYIAKRKWLEKMKRGRISRDRVLIEPQQQQTPVRQMSSGSSGITEFGSPPPLGELKKRSEEEKQRRMKKVLMKMPHVFAKGDGPNGKKIDGFLYRYNNEEDVRIVCVCHGSFHSPTEFVKHAGAKNVVNPLRDIIVTPFLFM